MKINITQALIIVTILVAVGFTTAYLYGWHQNAIAGTKYDLQNLVETAKWIIGQLITLFGSHSLLNTAIPGLAKSNPEDNK